MSDKVRVIRILEYVGTRDQVEGVIEESLHGSKIISGDLKITAVTLGAFPEIMIDTVADVKNDTK